jgi:hypothetical protein
MATALNLGGGSFRPIVKYNASTGKWAARTAEGEYEIDAPTMVVDLANILTGWAWFMEGKAPSRQFDPSLDVQSPQPSESHKRCFMALCSLPEHFTEAAEFCSNSVHLGSAVNDLYKSFAKQRGEHAGKVPVVTCTGTIEKPGKFAVNRKPVFEITDWIERPVELPDESPADPSEVWHESADDDSLF